MTQTQRPGGWLQTFEGSPFFPLDPQVGDISIIDIAHALSLICRFGGHTREFYSVAEHSIIVSKLVSPENALRGLLHDAAEAYLGDVVTPLKRSLPEYKIIENSVLATISERYDLGVIGVEEVKIADMRLLLNERNQLMNQSIYIWDLELHGVTPYPDLVIEQMSPREAEAAFVARFWELYNPKDFG